MVVTTLFPSVHDTVPESCAPSCGVEDSAVAAMLLPAPISVKSPYGHGFAVALAIKSGPSKLSIAGGNPVTTTALESVETAPTWIDDGVAHRPVESHTESWMV